MSAHEKAIEAAGHAIGYEIGGTQNWEKIALAVVIAFLRAYVPSDETRARQGSTAFNHVRDTMIRELEGGK